jgi:hypothetical protein
MKVKTILYQKVFSLPNFQNEKIGIEIELEDNEKASDVIEKAKVWAERVHLGHQNISQEVLNAKAILADSDHYTGKQVKDAQAIIDKFNEGDDLPF